MMVMRCSNFQLSRPCQALTSYVHVTKDPAFPPHFLYSTPFLTIMSSSSLTLYLLTANLARLPHSPTSLSAALTPTLPPTPPHLFIVALQETSPLSATLLSGIRTGPNLTPIVAAVLSAAESAYSDTSYKLLGGFSLGGTALLAFSLPHLHPNLAWDAVGLGPGGLGSKAAVSLRVGFDGEEVTVVGAHLSANEYAVAARDREMVYAAGELLPPGGRAVLMGDLNYRTASARPDPGTRFPSPEGDWGVWEGWWKRDQLVSRDYLGMGWGEGVVRWRPSYKYLLGSDEWARNRWPSWTDRVLYKGDGMKVEGYGCVGGYRGSDHRPVYAWITVDGVGTEGGEGRVEAVQRPRGVRPVEIVAGGVVLGWERGWWQRSLVVGMLVFAGWWAFGVWVA
jgi:endonuclease/exonuclease/phosphatase family metal-dependent hydrolase